MGTGTPGPGVIAAPGRRAHSDRDSAADGQSDRDRADSRAASLSVARRACAGTGPSLRDFHGALGWPEGLPSRRDALSHPSVSRNGPPALSAIIVSDLLLDLQIGACRIKKHQLIITNIELLNC